MSDEIVMKLNAIGSYRVGKTSLIKRYAEGQFSSDYLPTLGVDVTVKRIKITFKKNQENIRLVLMDTAGQEQFGSLRSTYYQGSLGCIAVYDVTRYESFTDLDRWIADYRSVAGEEVPIIIIGNKIDLEDLRKVTMNEGKKFALSNGYPFYECSAKLGGGVIPEIYTKLAQMILARINV
ncbi:MAG: Rab family GTPase [Candidatus Hodarchaeota archaeon]